MTNYPVSKDHRYTVEKEFCGHPAPQFIARFCNEWIGQSQFYSSAALLAIGHDANRRGLPIIEEVR